MHVLSTDLHTFEDNVKKAFWAKDIERQIRVDEAMDKSVQLSLKRTNSASLLSQQPQGKKQKAPVDQQQKIYCDFCGRAGHTKPDCRKKNNACYNCGEMGHIISYCQNPAAIQDRLPRPPIAAQALRQAPPTPPRPLHQQFQPKPPQQPYPRPPQKRMPNIPPQQKRYEATNVVESILYICDRP